MGTVISSPIGRVTMFVTAIRYSLVLTQNSCNSAMLWHGRLFGCRSDYMRCVDIDVQRR